MPCRPLSLLYFWHESLTPTPFEGCETLSQDSSAEHELCNLLVACPGHLEYSALQCSVDERTCLFWGSTQERWRSQEAM